jgi:hypothetical protein
MKKIMVKRSKVLPFGGEWHTIDTAPLVKRLAGALEFGKKAGKIEWGESAKDLWTKVYGPLSEGKPGLFGAVVGRAEAQVVRLAAVYTVMNLSNTIELAHLKAALALWEYAEDSARYVFGDTTGDPAADRIVEALRAAPKGLSRNEIRNLFGRHRSSERIGQSLEAVERLNRVRRVTAGQPLDVFIAGDDEEAKETVAQLVSDGGLRAIDVGPMERARQLEGLGFLGITLQQPLGLNFQSAWKLIS